MSFSKEDILEALGIDEENWMLPALAGFGVGCLVGAGVALVLAPKSGRELRADLKDRGRDIMEKGREVSQKIREREGTPPTTTY
jgi:gas vesicle protein